MVFPDLSAPAAVPNDNHEVAFPIAKPLDRVFAFVLDFLIFYPVLGFLLSGLTLQLKKSTLVAPQSWEGMAALALMAVAAGVLVILFQTLFLVLFRGTPGMLFMQLRVRDINYSDRPLSFNQAFQRSFFWTVSAALLGWPFIEIFGHPLRRHFADRGSDTLVVTFKKDFDLGPTLRHWNSVQSWMRLFILMGMFLGMALYSTAYKTFLQNAYHKEAGEEAVAMTCLEPDKDSQFTVLDRAITLYLADNLSRECLRQEADAVLWGNSLDDRNLAYFAKFLVSNKDDKIKYQEKICGEENSIICGMTEYLAAAGKSDLDLNLESELASLKYLNSEILFHKGQYVRSVKVLNELMSEKDFDKVFDRKYARAVWMLQGLDRVGVDRQPAAETATILEDFKERFEIP